MSKYINIDKVLSELCLSHKDIIYIDKNETAERIRKIPSVDIEPKRGEWIDKGRNLWGCSNCGMEIYSESEQDRNEFHKWCSRCGARMKGADDEASN